MKIEKTILSPEMQSVRNYGIAALITLLALHILILGSLRHIEMKELRNELSVASESLSTATSSAKRVIRLPEDIIAIHTKTLERTGFYEIKTDKDYLAYANPKNNYILTKAENSVQHEMINVAIALTALYLGEVIILVGWWFFIKEKVRALFEIK